MILKFTKQAEKNYKKLPANIQKKADKQFASLLSDYRHPSLRARKMGGENCFEGRIDLHYRFIILGFWVYRLLHLRGGPPAGRAGF